MIVPDQIDAIVQSLFIGASESDEQENERVEPAAGTIEDPNGHDNDDDVIQALLAGGQEDDEPMEADETVESDGIDDDEL